MKTKSAYLLCFCFLLSNYCYLCWGYCQNDDGNEVLCSNFIHYDVDSIFLCKFKVEDYGGYSKSTSCQKIDGAKYGLGCEAVNSAFIGKNISDNGLCESIKSDSGKKCSYSDGVCELKTCEQLTKGCDDLQYCGTYEGQCKINDCRGLTTEADCQIKVLDANNTLFCKWESNNCRLMMCNEGSSDCLFLVPSGEDYKCFSDGEKCVESNSCENVEVKNADADVLSSICSLFPHCSPGNNNDCTNNCNKIASEEQCNYALKDDNTFIKCKWNESGPTGKQCQVDGSTEITSCDDAKNSNDIKNEQCSILNVSQGNNYCRKGPEGCFEFKDCDDIKVKVDSSICLELTKPEDELQCIPNGENGCKKELVQCLEYSLYIYNKSICEKLNVSSEDYKCFSDGEKCIEANSCDSIKDTTYDTNSADLKKICDLFDFCEPYEKGCKTKITPTTIDTILETEMSTTYKSNTIEFTETTIEPIESSNVATIPSISQTTILEIEPATIPNSLPDNKENTKAISQTSQNSLEKTIEQIASTINEKTTMTEIINSSDNKVISSLSENSETQKIISTNGKDSTIINSNASDTILSQTQNDLYTTNKDIYTNSTNIINTDTINNNTNIETEIPTTYKTNTIESTKTTIESKESSNEATIPSISQTTILEIEPATIPNSLPDNKENTKATSQASQNSLEKTIEQMASTINEKTMMTEIINSSDNKVISSLSENSETQKNDLYTTNKDIYTNSTNIINTDTINNTIPFYQKNEEETLAILLGINLLRLYEFYFSFNIYFLPVKNSIFSYNLIFPITVLYNSNIRLLLSKEFEGNCNLIKKHIDSKYEYFCTVETETKNIKQIKATPSQQNFKIIGETPIAKMYMNNLLLIDEKFDGLSNSFIYILDNCTLEQKNKKIFDISGSMKNPLDKLYKNYNLTIMMNIESTDRSVMEMDCYVANATGSNYTLSCNNNEIFNADLQSSISFLDNNTILLINFDYIEYYNNNALINTNIDSLSHRYFKKNENSLKPVYIIIISLVIALVIFVVLCIYLRQKGKIGSDASNESSITKFKAKDSEIV